MDVGHVTPVALSLTRFLFCMERKDVSGRSDISLKDQSNGNPGKTKMQGRCHKIDQW